MLCCALPLVSRVLAGPTSALMFHAKRDWKVDVFAVSVWRDERRDPLPSPASPVLPAVLPL